MPNVLPLTDRDIEASAGTWVANANCTVARSTLQAHGGTASLAMVSTAGSFMIANSGVIGGIRPGESLTIGGWVRAGTTVRAMQFYVDWFDFVGGTNISASFNSGVTDSNSAWTQNTGVQVVPADITACRLNAQINTSAIGEIHYIDDMFITVPDTGVFVWNATESMWVLANNDQVKMLKWNGSAWV